MCARASAAASSGEANDVELSWDHLVAHLRRVRRVTRHADRSIDVECGDTSMTVELGEGLGEKWVAIRIEVCAAIWIDPREALSYNARALGVLTFEDETCILRYTVSLAAALPAHVERAIDSLTVDALALQAVARAPRFRSAELFGNFAD
jgi:hypothetical protein